MEKRMQDQVNVDGVRLSLSSPHENTSEWIGQCEILDQLLACWLVVDDADLPLAEAPQAQIATTFSSSLMRCLGDTLAQAVRFCVGKQAVQVTMARELAKRCRC